jgi:hypothetical protein
VLLELSVVEQGYDAVMEVLRDGLGVSEVAQAVRGFPPEPAHLPAPVRERRASPGWLTGRIGPKSCPHQIGTETEALILELRRLNMQWGRIAHELSKQGWDHPPSRASVYRAFAGTT